MNIAAAAGPAGPMNIANNADPIALKVERARRFRAKRLTKNQDGMPDEAAARAELTAVELQMADAIDAEFDAHIATLAVNNNIVDQSGNAHRPLTGAAGKVGVTALLAAKQSSNLL